MKKKILVFHGKPMREPFLVKKIIIGETKQNVITRRNEHENPNKDSVPAKHLF